MMKRHYTWLALLLALCLVLSGCMDSPTSDGSETTLSEERTDSPAGNGDPQTPPANEGSEEPKEIKNLILIIGDGMGMEHIAAGQLARGKHYDFTDWIRCSVNTNSIDSNGRATVVTNSAAAATALVTGTLTVNGYVGKDAEGRNLETILDVATAFAESRGDTAVVVTADHETGGLCVSKQEVLANSYVYNQKVGKIYYSFSSNDHTDADVGLFLYGTTFDFAELPFMSSSHLIKNCDVPLMLRRILTGKTT